MSLEKLKPLWWNRYQHQLRGTAELERFARIEKADAKRVRAMAAEHPTWLRSSIARECGLSVVRVSQILGRRRR